MSNDLKITELVEFTCTIYEAGKPVYTHKRFDHNGQEYSYYEFEEEASFLIVPEEFRDKSGYQKDKEFHPDFIDSALFVEPIPEDEISKFDDRTHRLKYEVISIDVQHIFPLFTGGYVKNSPLEELTWNIGRHSVFSLYMEEILALLDRYKEKMPLKSNYDKSKNETRHVIRLITAWHFRSWWDSYHYEGNYEYYLLGEVDWNSIKIKGE